MVDQGVELVGALSGASCSPRTRSRGCLECGRVFTPSRDWHFHCSDACRTRGWKDRQKALDFEPRKLARATDPETSHDAAEAAEGLRRHHIALILDALLTSPATSEEVSQRTPLTHPQAWRRMGELQAKGYVKDTGLRRANLSGRMATVWALADEPSRAKP